MKRLSLIISLCLITGSDLWAQEPYWRSKNSSQGYYNITQLSFLIAEENASSPAKSNMVPSVVNINGYRFNDYVSMGVGVGMTALSYTIFPIFADLRVTLFEGDLSPIVVVKGGYAFSSSKKEIFQNAYYNVDYKNRGGGMFNPELGFKLKMTERADFMLTIGYWFQHVSSEMKPKDESIINQIHHRTSDLNRLSLSISFLFK